MRLSCNGCRVLRKGCSESCPIRPCLQWIKSSESQSNATLFLAKFYGRAGLLNLINASPPHLRPATFKSLLYDACGRIVNPVHGSTGLVWSGNWNLCQAAVEAVLNGSQIAPVPSELAVSSMSMPFKACDIRHVSRDENSAAYDRLHKVQSRNRFKRSAGKKKPKVELKSETEVAMESAVDNVGGDGSSCARLSWSGSASRDSGLTQPPSPGGDSGDADNDSRGAYEINGLDEDKCNV
ncbi:hypothetical protein FEM48_Zijuj05G0105200 [Ziziphus jujuba var. spinosa]|uniref:LOB domain-containing protein n=1 Tax=Ziziphus jujuba var. spinosa TaxID=714518 RepID=A0A978VEG1_ZIZJJ|nr:hypothetical protein FEM48_Zijuj05G0105200 [Ziziphus jujuba var. spinosa]